MNANAVYENVNQTLLDDIKRELRLQGHYLTGELEASFQAIVSKIDNGVSLSATAADYLESLENYTPPEQINITESEFQKLKKWVLARGLASFEVEATAVAAAIIRKWKKEGRPTAESVQFSKNGRRTQAVEVTFKEKDRSYGALIDSNIGGLLNEEFAKTKSGVV